MANHNKRKQRNEPIRARSKTVTDAKRGKTRATNWPSRDWLSRWREFFKPIKERSKAKPKQFSDYFRHSIENRSNLRQCYHKFAWLKLSYIFLNISLPVYHCTHAFSSRSLDLARNFTSFSGPYVLTRRRERQGFLASSLSTWQMWRGLVTKPRVSRWLLWPHTNITVRDNNSIIDSDNNSMEHSTIQRGIYIKTKESASLKASRELLLFK